MTHIDWYPYPEEKPKEEKQYLISFYVYKEKRHGVDIDFYNPEHDVWDVYDDGVYTRVTAWAERPEPYKEPEPLDMHPDAITARKYALGDPETVKALHIFDKDEND